MPLLNIAVVGGGMGGLACAATFAKHGHHVTVYERSKSTTDVGFAFRITPNSERCLTYLGIDTIEGGAVPVSAVRALNGEGKVMFEREENVQDRNDENDGDEKKKKKKGTSVFAFRPQLTQQLLDVALNNGVTVKTGVKVTGVDTTKTELTIEHNANESESTAEKTTESLQFDLIIAADGLSSHIRPSIVDPNKWSPQASTHHNCIRFMVPSDSIHNDPHLSSVINEKYNLASWRHEDKRVLVYPVDYGKQYNVVCTHPEDLSEAALEENKKQQQQATHSKSDDNTSPTKQETERDTTYDNTITLPQSIALYTDTDPTNITRLFNHADSSGFRIWKLQDLEELPTWSVNRTILIGDAAHACLPFGFSGASMAIEDAVVLGEMIAGREDLGRTDADGDDEEMKRLLKKFEVTRKPRITRVRETGRMIGRGQEEKKVLGEYMEWLGEYDAVEVGRGLR